MTGHKSLRARFGWQCGGGRNSWYGSGNLAEGASRPGEFAYNGGMARHSVVDRDLP